MKVVIELLSGSWDLIQTATFRKSWRKIIPMECHVECDDEEVDDDDFLQSLHEVGCDQQQLDSWLNSDCNDPGFGTFTDAEIWDMVTADDITDEVVEEEEEEKCPVTHSEAAHMFEQCLTWLEHQPEANQYSTSTIKSLQLLASQKRTKSMKQLKLQHFSVKES